MVVDDTVVYRKIVSDIISELPGMEVVGTAHNGKSAISKIPTLKPDLLTLDIEMPEMSGIEVLETLQRHTPEIGAIMLSTLTQKGGEMTMKALELGAFDFIPKPDSGTIDKNKAAIKNIIAPMLKAFARGREIRGILNGKGTPGRITPLLKTPVTAKSKTQYPSTLSTSKKNRSKIVVIGISTGGPNALAEVLPRIPENIGVPILIVQHMPPVFTQSLAKSLNRKCSIEIREASNMEPVLPNTALIAPGGKQMKIVAGADGKTRVIKITDDAPENNCKPSVDYLFRSVAHLYLGRATGVIMTGMGSDGTLGLTLMKRNGATIIAQDEASCTVFGMPRKPIETGITDVVSSLSGIAAEILKTTR
jgi:two-component system, chemotaxis family, protein-glutamate methylesterase/glutaminase